MSTCSNCQGLLGAHHFQQQKCLWRSFQPDGWTLPIFVILFSCFEPRNPQFVSFTYGTDLPCTNFWHILFTSSAGHQHSPHFLCIIVLPCFLSMSSSEEAELDFSEEPRSVKAKKQNGIFQNRSKNGQEAKKQRSVEAKGSNVHITFHIYMLAPHFSPLVGTTLFFVNSGALFDNFDHSDQYHISFLYEITYFPEDPFI